MPETKPEIYLNDNQVCNLCENYENINHNNNKLLESDLVSLINNYRGKHKYDCLVMCSGGKDSVSALYYMTKRYKLSVLAFTFDNGFENQVALKNVNTAIEKLAVDFLYYKSNFMNDMFEDVLKSGSKAVLCHLCSIWYMNLAYDIAEKYDIPLIVAGWTNGQSTSNSTQSKYNRDEIFPEFKKMNEASKEYLNRKTKDSSKYKDFPKSMDEVIKSSNKKHKSIVISPHWFLPFDEKDYVKTIKDELGWKAPKDSYPKGSTNCYLNYISVYNSIKYFGFSHYHIEMSKLIREGSLTRKEALEKLKIDFNIKQLNSIAQKLNFKID